MKEAGECEFQSLCEKLYPEKEMNEYRKKCDFVNRMLCDYYWIIYDKKYLLKGKGEIQNGQ